MLQMCDAAIHCEGGSSPALMTPASMAASWTDAQPSLARLPVLCEIDSNKQEQELSKTHQILLEQTNDVRPTATSPGMASIHGSQAPGGARTEQRANGARSNHRKTAR